MTKTEADQLVEYFEKLEAVIESGRTWVAVESIRGMAEKLREHSRNAVHAAEQAEKFAQSFN